MRSEPTFVPRCMLRQHPIWPAWRSGLRSNFSPTRALNNAVIEHLWVAALPMFLDLRDFTLYHSRLLGYLQCRGWKNYSSLDTVQIFIDSFAVEARPKLKVVTRLIECSCSERLRSKTRSSLLTNCSLDETELFEVILKDCLAEPTSTPIFHRSHARQRVLVFRN